MTHAKIQNGAKTDVVTAPFDLRAKALRPGNHSSAALEAISNAEKAMEELSVNFQDWMGEESLRLGKARDAAKSARFTGKPREELFHSSHDIKGQASTLGYPFAAEICASLCRLLEYVADAKRIPPLLVDQHVDAVRAIVRDGVKGSDDPTANKLAIKLRDVTENYLADEEARNLAANEV